MQKNYLIRITVVVEKLFLWLCETCEARQTFEATSRSPYPPIWLKTTQYKFLLIEVQSSDKLVKEMLVSKESGCIHFVRL